MFGKKLGVNMHIVAVKPAAVRNITAAVGRCHLEIAGLVVSPYAAGLAALVDDETDLGVTIIDMGAGTTTIGVFFDGHLIFADCVPVGGRDRAPRRARARGPPPGQADPQRPAAARRRPRRGDGRTGLLARRRAPAFRAPRTCRDATPGARLERGARRTLRPRRSLAEGKL